MPTSSPTHTQLDYVGVGILDDPFVFIRKKSIQPISANCGLGCREWPACCFEFRITNWRNGTQAVPYSGKLNFRREWPMCRSEFRSRCVKSIWLDSINLKKLKKSLLFLILYGNIIFVQRIVSITSSLLLLTFYLIYGGIAQLGAWATRLHTPRKQKIPTTQ